MKSRKTMVVVVGGVVVAVVAAAVYAQSRGALSAAAAQLHGASLSATAAPAAAPELRPQLTRLQVDLFELRCSREQLLKLDLMAVGQTDAGPMKASAEQVLERLRQLGEASLAVRYDNFVDLVSGTRLMSGKSVPTIKDVSLSDTGIVVPSVAYEGVGFTVDVRGAWLEQTEPNLANIDFDVEMSALAPQQLNVGYSGQDSKLNLPIYDQFSSQQRLVARQGLPVLLACNDLSKPSDAKGTVSVLVARLVATRLIE